MVLFILFVYAGNFKPCGLTLPVHAFKIAFLQEVNWCACVCMCVCVCVCVFVCVLVPDFFSIINFLIAPDYNYGNKYPPFFQFKSDLKIPPCGKLLIK